MYVQFVCLFRRYACSKSGHVFEIHYSSVSLKRVWHLLPGNGGGVAITALCLHEAFSVTGSEDGILRVWPADFSSPFLEAGIVYNNIAMFICVSRYYVVI